MLDLQKGTVWLSNRRFIALLQQITYQMNQHNQDPFIIIKASRNDEAFKRLPSIKKRKPTVHTWTQRENIIYVEFLKANRELMDSRQDRKSCKIFKKLAELIKTRTSMQVKSHHQKLQQKYKRAKIIIAKVLELIALGRDITQTRDAEISVDIKEEFCEDQICLQTTLSFQQDAQYRYSEERSRDQSIFFEEESDNYLQFEGVNFFEQAQPLI